MPKYYWNDYAQKAVDLFRIVRLFPLAVGLVGCAHQAAGGIGTIAPPMQVGATIAPPSGFLDFCARQPADCGLELNAPTDIGAFASTEARRQLIYSRYKWDIVFHDKSGELASEIVGQSLKSGPSDIAGAKPIVPVTSEWPQRKPTASPSTRQMNEDRLSGPTGLGSNLSVEGLGHQVGRPSDELQDWALDPRKQMPIRVGQTADRLGRTGPIPLSPTLGATLHEVNELVNRTIRPVRDSFTEHDEASWTLPIEESLTIGGPIEGDCKDFALEKRHALIAAGVPATVLSVAIVDTRWGWHAVLLVNTDAGELVLDSLRSDIIVWNKTRYRWIERQTWGDPLSWRTVASR